MIASSAAEACLSPFFTYLCGAEMAPLVPSFPVRQSVPWTQAPRACLDAVDLINERATRMFPGEQESVSFLTILCRLTLTSQKVQFVARRRLSPAFANSSTTCERIIDGCELLLMWGSSA